VRTDDVLAGLDRVAGDAALLLTPQVLKALRTVLPPAVKLLPVGGITPQNLAPYMAAGASGFGLGSALFRPGNTAQQVAAQARAFVDAWRAAAS